jgi:hypothetical protein
LAAPPPEQVGRKRLGTSARGFFKPRRLKGLRVGVISEDWPVWLEVLPSLGITSILARENGQEFINRCFAGTVPGLSITTSMERLLHSNLDLVFISGGPSFVRQKCSFCRDLSIVATSHARGNRLGELSLTTLVWTYVEHSEVGGVTDGKYWVGANLTRGRISSQRTPTSGFLAILCHPWREGQHYTTRPPEIRSLLGRTEPR